MVHQYSLNLAGTSKWQICERPNFQGSNVVLGPGDYPNSALLPFGDNAGSLRVIISTETPRQDITDYHGIGKFLSYLKT